jgi:hypothetical protein
MTDGGAPDSRSSMSVPACRSKRGDPMQRAFAAGLLRLAFAPAAAPIFTLNGS